MKRRLLEHFKMGSMELRNRMIMPPITSQYGSVDGWVSERTKDYYEARAMGGVALIIVEATYVHIRGRSFTNQLAISDDKFVPGMSELAQVIHSHGAKAFVQLHHAGGRAEPALTSMRPMAPSAIHGPLPMLSAKWYDGVPEELTTAEIAEIIRHFAEATLRAKKAGFDGVQLHAGHGFLFNQFLSRSSNKRQDIYGGDLVNRSRFLAEVIAAIKRVVGMDYPVWCRINGKEYGVEEGITPEEAQGTARLAQEAGIDAIDVSTGGPKGLPSFALGPAVVADLAAGIEKAVTVPVIVSGKMTPDAAERILAEGKADLIGIGRGLLADPELPQKLADNRLEDIKPCIDCNACRDDVRSSVGIRCSVNPVLGREQELKIAPTKRPKRVLVVGGGPAGMETARVAALRGHKVTLLEKESRLGGQLIPAAVAPYKDQITLLTKYFQVQLKKLNVAVQLNKEAIAKVIEELKPEVLIVGTGAKPLIPEIPGLDRACAVQAVDVLKGGVKVGERVIVIGGELVACEVAEFLAERGKKVTMMRRGPQFAVGVGPTQRPFLLDRLSRMGVSLLTEVTYNEAIPGGLMITNRQGERKLIEADTIVLATGPIPEAKLYEETKTKLAEVHCVGDCVAPRKIRDAIEEGYRTGLEI